MREEEKERLWEGCIRCDWRKEEREQRLERNRVHSVSGSFYFGLNEAPPTPEEKWWRS